MPSALTSRGRIIFVTKFKGPFMPGKFIQAYRGRLSSKNTEIFNYLFQSHLQAPAAEDEAACLIGNDHVSIVLHIASFSSISYGKLLRNAERDKFYM